MKVVVQLELTPKEAEVLELALSQLGTITAPRVAQKHPVEIERIILKLQALKK